MQERLRSWLRGIRDRWNALERRQKFQIAGAAAAVVLALIVALWFAFRTTYTMAYPNVDAEFASQATNMWDQHGIKNQNRSGNLYVEKKDLSKAIAVLYDSPPQGLEKYTFADALSNSGMGVTQTMQKESLTNARAGKLEAILERMNGIKSAHVVLYIPSDDNFFLSQDSPATAMVNLETTHQLSTNEGQSIAKMVVSGTPKLDLDNVTVVDENYNMLYSGQNGSDGGGINGQADFEAQYQAIKEAKIRTALNPLYEDVRIISTLNFNWDVINQRSTVYTPSNAEDGTGYVDSRTTESQKGTDTGSAAAPGTDTNNNQTPGYPTQNGSSSKVDIKNEQVQYLYDVIETVKQSGDTGNLLYDSSSIGIYCYRNKIYYEDTITDAQLGGLTWAQFKEQTGLARINDVDADLLPSLQQATGIGNITLLAYERPMFVDATVKPLNIWTIVLMSLVFLFVLLMAYGLIRRTKQEEEVEIEEPLSVEDLLVSTQIEEQKAEEIEKQRLQEIEFGEDSEIKKQIQKFINEKPEAVAGLLRNWLNEDWE